MVRKDHSPSHEPRDHVAFAINGELVRARAADLVRPLSTFLRERLALRGTKVVCEEGDCGACSVLVGRVDTAPAGAAMAPIRYRVVDSCILYLFQLDGAHVVTIEGLSATRGGEDGVASALQEAMVSGHASQCGFCTPGFVVAAAALFDATGIAEEGPIDRERVGIALSGNLCRCTGYVQIVDACLTAAGAPRPAIDERYPPEALRALLGQATAGDVEARVPLLSRFSSCGAPSSGIAEGTVLVPATLRRALELRRLHPDAKVVAGATDVGVQLNKGTLIPTTVLDLNRVRELEGIAVTDGVLIAGARATWTEIDAATRDRLPALHAILEVFGAPQIRNLGTIGGNLANASPIADSLPLLYVLDAEVELASLERRRSVPITSFYRGYKDIDLASDELIVAVRARLPAEDELLRLFKISRRRDLDIASFTAAVRLSFDGERILTAALAFGAVGPTVLRARATEDFLIGRDFTLETMTRAGVIAVGEISPIDDVRGARDFRYQLTRNVLKKTRLEWRPRRTGAAA